MQQAPWTVRGVSPEAQSKARGAAADRQMRIGKWISHALTTVADSELTNPMTELTKPMIGVMPAVSAAERRAAGKRPRDAKQQAPWSVRGVSEEALTKAKKAAANRHTTLGRWVSHALTTIADGTQVEPMVDTVPTDRPNPAGPLLVEPPVDDAERHGVKTRRSENKPQTPWLARGDRAESAPDAAAPPAGPALAESRPVAAPGEELSRAVQSLTRHGEESRKSEQAIAKLLEHLDGLARAEQQMSELAKRFSDLDQRDNALLALARRQVDSQSKNEQRLSALTTAISLLADRVYASEGQSVAAGGDIDRSLASIISALGSLAVNKAALPGAPAAAGADAHAPADDRETAAAAPIPAREPPPPPEWQPHFDFDKLNEKAIENTRRSNPEA